MPTVELTPVGPRVKAVLLDGGKTIWSDTFSPDSARGRKGLLVKTGATDDLCLDWLDKTRAAGRTVSFPVPEAPAPPAPIVPTIRVRGLETRDGETSPFPDPAAWIHDSLPSVPVGHVAEWKDAAVMCCLDIDYHTHSPPPRDWLETLMLTRIAPRPLAWHFSRSGGVHAFYVAADPFTAEELAAVAALRFRSFDEDAGLELKRVVRGPGGEKVHVAPTQETGGGIAAWAGPEDHDEAARDEWLEARGMVVGGRYDHERCPINPTPGHASKGMPVCVSASGVFCHRCQGEGRSLGSKRAGSAPWPALIGSPSAGDLGLLIRNTVHWGHARLVLVHKYRVPEALARLAYSAALKAYHTGGPLEYRLPYVWAPVNEDTARVDDEWMDVNDLHAYGQIPHKIGRLPAAVVQTDDGPKTDKALVEELQQPKNLHRYGYTTMRVVHGFKMAEPYLSNTYKETVVAVPDRGLPESCRPRYVNRSARMPEEEAWAELEKIAPGIDRTLVKVACVAFATAQETRCGLLPMIFVSGPTGVAKTTTLKLAAGVYGACAKDIPWKADTDRFHQAIREGAHRGPCIIFNEILKDAARSKQNLSAKEALDPILNVTPDATTHVLYKGSLPMGRPPAIFFTEPVCPYELRKELQLARRVRHYRLHKEKNWQKTFSAAGLTDPNLLRAVSPAVNRACDTILSSICDEWFSVEARTFDEMADAMGVFTIRDSPDFEDDVPLLREFFRLLCLLPALTGKDEKLYPGYRRVCRGDPVAPGSTEDNLLTVYTAFADGSSGNKWLTSRKLEEKSWSEILGVSEPVYLDMKTDGSAVFIRFRQGTKRKPGPLWTDIIDPTHWETVL